MTVAERPGGGAAGEQPFAVLRRWEDSGGTWRVAWSDATVVELELLTCSGGEVMGHLRTDDPDVRARVADALG